MHDALPFMHNLCHHGHMATPTLARRILAQKLRQLRTNAGITLAAAGEELGREGTTIGRWEKGSPGARRHDIQALAKLYGATPDEMSRMTSLLLQAGERGIWEGSSVPAHLRVLYESELLAESIYYLDLDYIPGLLQTPEYLTAAQEVLPSVDPDRNEQVQQNYQQRQTGVLHGDHQPRLEFVIGLAALEYIRKTDVYDGQITALRDANALPNVDIRILTGLHAAMIGSFTLIDPGNAPLDPFTFIEALDGCRYVETPVVVSQYRATFDAARKSAIPLEEYLR